jgi:hypothetical protein
VINWLAIRKDRPIALKQRSMTLSPGIPTGDNMYRYASRISDTWLADNADNWTGLNVLLAWG